MAKPIERTGVTGLTDSELLILDKVAMLGGVRSMYFDDVFPLQFNCPAHGLDDPLHIETLERFETRGILTSKPTENRHGESDRTTRMMQTGGSKWEMEREPDWTRYSHFKTCVIAFCLQPDPKLAKLDPRQTGDASDKYPPNRR